MHRKLLLIPALALPALISHAADEDAEKSWKGSSELGYINTSGNTDTTSLNAKFGVMHSGENWDTTFKADALTSEEDGTTSKEKYASSLQFDRNFTKHHYLLFLGEYEDDRFSGYEYQSQVSVGYGYRAINNDTMQLDLEIGPGYRYDRLDEGGETEDETILRTAANYFWEIRDGVEFTQEVSADTGSDNTILRSETGLKSQINGSLATKLTYSIKHTKEVPEDSENTDREFGVTLVYSF
ncbi:MAG: hypothetical protein CMI08_04325 [Oceanospirillaceae bacterium]|uniref:DUF481 domain-containing protein n=1 Tax=unclassified Thalassolituus TaxID=2624967 RepID=UPI000C42CE8F|nr:MULTISPECIES: DUF481 domain-containing protein [unclassified Thalassolituus]MAS24669.1 hypothetical protein [Oceanospirillaceae bacterium]MAX98421.1 hypothetical protein [Oceanospirillaceae bacterium]MBL35592.1 hypothetical protein [Oceanospirillaceae bacterium]MBS51189.1 hypothetical protein [Oceanospirillaceae bacterium]|tara:strand:- start:1776 stop:2495 length:720 start_codon:yes stop_codon:yes gene_type:complete